MRSRLLWLSAILATVWAIYFSGRNFDFIVDDYTYVVNNPAVTDGVPWRRYFLDPTTAVSPGRLDFAVQSYRPVRTLAFYAVAQVADVEPLPFHLANLLLYSISIALLYWCLLRLSGDALAATLATLWWAVLSVHVEPVIYISALGDHLALICEVGALILATRGMSKAVTPRQFVVLLVASLGLQALAMGTKEPAITAVAVLALLVWQLYRFAAWSERLLGAPLSRARARTLLIGHALLAAAYFALRTLVLRHLGHATQSYLGVLLALCRAPYFVLEYLRICLQLFGHHPAYEVAPSFAILVATTLGFAVLIWLAYRAQSPLIGFGLGFFVLSLAPVLHFIPIAAHMADRFALLPSLGLAMLATAGLQACRHRRWAVVLMIALCGGLALASGIELRHFKDDAVLWRYAYAEQPNSILANSNFGTVLLRAGDFAAALKRFDFAKRAGRKDAYLELQRAYAWQRLGDTQAAETAVQESLALDDRVAAAHAFWGEMRLLRGDLEGARRQAKIANQQWSTSPGTQRINAAIAVAERRFDAALVIYRQLQQRFPRDPTYRQLIESTEQARSAQPK